MKQVFMTGLCLYAITGEGVRYAKKYTVLTVKLLIMFRTAEGEAFQKVLTNPKKVI